MHADAPSPDPSGTTDPHRGTLIVMLGILGSACFLFGLAAFVLAKGDLARMDTGEVDDAGRGLTRLGMTVGMVGVAVQAIILIFFVLYVDGGIISDTATSPASGLLTPR